MLDDQRLTVQSNVLYFDHVADRYAALYLERSPIGVGFHLRRRRVLDLFDKPGGVVLDVGCGPGILVEDLLSRGCTYWGIDHSAKMIEQCERRFGERGNAQFRLVEGEETGFPDQSFDAVVCMGVLDRLEHDGAVLREMVRVLKPGGTLLVTLSNRWSPYLWWRDFGFYPAAAVLRHLTQSVLGRPGRPSNPPHRLHAASSIRRRLDALGLATEAIGYTGYPIIPAPLDQVFPIFAAGAMERLESLRHGPLRGFGFCFIVKGRASRNGGARRD